MYVPTFMVQHEVLNSDRMLAPIPVYNCINFTYVHIYVRSYIRIRMYTYVHIM